MIRKIIVLTSLVFLESCLFVGFNKGANYEKSVKFKSYNRNGNMVLKIIDNSVHAGFSNLQCGGYGLFGVIIPIIPYWGNDKCEDLNVLVTNASNVYIKYNNKVYNYSEFNPRSSYNYKFPIPVKSLSSGAILVIEKDGEKFEIPFRYKHTFSFQLWGT